MTLGMETYLHTSRLIRSPPIYLEMIDVSFVTNPYDISSWDMYFIDRVLTPFFNVVCPIVSPNKYSMISIVTLVVATSPVYTLPTNPPRWLLLAIYI